MCFTLGPIACELTPCVFTWGSYRPRRPQGPRLGSYCFGSSCLSSSRLGSPRLGPSFLGALRFGLDSPLLGSSRFGTELDLELELVEHPARFDCDQLWASYAPRQLEFKIQVSSVWSGLFRGVSRGMFWLSFRGVFRRVFRPLSVRLASVWIRPSRSVTRRN